MESLEETKWDVVLAGTGISQSLLALALSRSGKKVLHVDKNDYYGGAEAALSLQEIEIWIDKVNDASQPSAFRNAILTKTNGDDGASSLGFSRAYSISLSPQLTYTRSNLLPALVSSKVHSQLEFLAVGSWWIHSIKADEDGQHHSSELRRIPGGREDVFSDKSIDLRSSRALMKFLKIAANAESHEAIVEHWGSKSFPEYLSSQFNISPALQDPLLALTSSPDPPAKTLTSFALLRIHRHLTSIGLFGPGFGSVLPKWGGLAEIAQVGCRAGAVGGGVYVLNKGVESFEGGILSAAEGAPSKDEEEAPFKVKFHGGEELKAHWLVGSTEDLPQPPKPALAQLDTLEISHSITIVSSPLSSLFHLSAEGAPPPAATVVVFPSGSIPLDSSVVAGETPPVYLTIHSSDTGECPAGQCIIYAQTSLPQPHATTLLTNANILLLSQTALFPNEPKAEILWSLYYTRLHRVPHPSSTLTEPTSSASTKPTTPASSPSPSNPKAITLPSPPPGLALDDSVLRNVKEVWAKINGGDDSSFMLFEERGGMGDEEEEGGEGDTEEDDEVERSGDDGNAAEGA